MCLKNVSLILEIAIHFRQRHLNSKGKGGSP